MLKSDRLLAEAVLDRMVVTKNLRINLIQPNVRAYRAEFFEALSAQLRWDLRVFYSGVDEAAADCSFEKYRVRAGRCGPFTLQFGLGHEMSCADVNIVMFDLRWPMGLFHGFRLQGNVPLILWGHGLGRSALAARLRVWLIKRASRTILYSYGARQNIIDYGVPAAKLVVAPNTMFVPNHGDLSGADKEYFLYVGRLQVRKGLEELVAAFAEYRRHLPTGYELVIVGDGCIKETLVQQTKRLGLSGAVRFYDGTTDPIQLRAIFQCAVAYVSPGHVGLGVLHAFSYGVPVVTTRGRAHAPEAEWIDHKVNGVFVAASTRALTQTMIELTEKADFTARLGHSAYMTYVNAASPSNMVGGFKEAVTGALGDCGKGGSE